MIPTVFQLGPLPVHSFGLMIALAVVAGVIRLQRSFAIRGIPEQLAERYVIAAALSGLIGARVWYVATYPEARSAGLVEALLSSGGFVFLGGFIVALLTLVVLAKLDRIEITALLDALGPAMALGYAIGRLGCQLSGDGDYGLTTTSWIGMSFESGVVPTPPGILVYPTPFFESVLALITLWLLTRAEARVWWRGKLRVFGAYLVLSGVARFIVEFWRINPVLELDWISRWVGITGLSEAQHISAALMLGGIGILITTLLVRFEDRREA